MGGKGSKAKGSTFERRIAKEILTAAGSGFGKQDCYRTPLSGGHQFAGASDLVISPKLLELFPFCVECKHRKSFRIDQMFHPTAEIISYHKQVLEAVKRDTVRVHYTDPEDGGDPRIPMVIIKPNYGFLIYASMPSDTADWYFKTKNKSCVLDTKLEYFCVDRMWTMTSFNTVLSAIKDWKAIRYPEAA